MSLNFIFELSTGFAVDNCYVQNLPKWPITIISFDAVSADKRNIQDAMPEIHTKWDLQVRKYTDVLIWINDHSILYIACTSSK